MHWNAHEEVCEIHARGQKLCVHVIILNYSHKIYHLLENNARKDKNFLIHHRIYV